MTLDSYLIRNVSIYSTAKDLNGEYFEVISELNAMRNGSEGAFAKAVFEEAGVML